MSKEQALALVSTDLDRVLGVKARDESLVVTSGGDICESMAKVVGLGSSRSDIER